MSGRAGIPEALAIDTARETVARFHEIWRRERDHLPITAALAAEVQRHLDFVPIAMER